MNTALNQCEYECDTSEHSYQSYTASHSNVVGSYHMNRKIVSKMIYNVPSGTLNPTIPLQRVLLLAAGAYRVGRWGRSDLVVLISGHQ